MSVIGTGVAAAVAQTAHQAQDVARRKDKKQTDKSRQEERVQDLFESHMQTLEEGDGAATPAQLRIDGEVPEHPHSHDIERRTQKHAAAEAYSANGQQVQPTDTIHVKPEEQPPAAKNDNAEQSSSTLYHHVDVRG